MISTQHVTVRRSNNGDIFTGLPCYDGSTDIGNACRCGKNETFFVFGSSVKQCYKDILTKTNGK